MVFSLLGINIANASYNLDNVKQDVKGFKIKTTHIRTDYGRDVTVRWGRLFVIETEGYPPSRLEFDLCEQDRINKYVKARFSYVGDRWYLFDHIRIGNGIRAINVYPEESPSREYRGGHCVETMNFLIDDRDQYDQWKDATEIRIIGKDVYDRFDFNEAGYAQLMQIMHEYLYR